MSGLDWRSIDRGELAALLDKTARVESRAVGEATVYRVDDGGRQALAIALPGGQALLIKGAAPAARKRRRVDS